MLYTLALGGVPIEKLSFYEMWLQACAVSGCQYFTYASGPLLTSWHLDGVR